MDGKPSSETSTQGVQRFTHEFGLATFHVKHPPRPHPYDEGRTWPPDPFCLRSHRTSCLRLDRAPIVGTQRRAAFHGTTGHRSGTATRASAPALIGVGMPTSGAQSCACVRKGSARPEPCRGEARRNARCRSSSVQPRRTTHVRRVAATGSTMPDPAPLSSPYRLTPSTYRPIRRRGLWR